ncbi:uncharacterized protein LOC144077901 [Stigmatopora argus]
MQSSNPQEKSTPVGWTSLVVISNVPELPTSPNEVKQLVHRFGTVLKSLPLKNTVICQMSTAAVALSVYKRFQKFPCILQNNPLFFSRKPDSKANIRRPTIAPPKRQSPERKLVKAEDNAPAVKPEEVVLKESVSEKIDKKPEIPTAPQKVVQAEEATAESEIVTSQAPSKSESAAPEAETKTDKEDKSTVEAVVPSETDASKKESIKQTTVKADNLENKTHAAQDTAIEEPILVDIAEEKAEPIENLDAKTTPDSENKDQVTPEADEGIAVTEERDEPKVVEDPKGTGKNQPETPVQVEVKAQDKEPLEKEAKKGKEQKVKEAKAPEKLPRAKSDQDYRFRRDKRERENDRKKEYSERSSRSRSSGRIEKKKSESDVVEQKVSNQVEEELPTTNDEEDFDSFLLSMGDFVTVDEVGDVADMDDFPTTLPPVAPEESPEPESSSLAFLSAAATEEEIPPMDVTADPVQSEEPTTDVVDQPAALAETPDSLPSDIFSAQSSVMAAPPIQSRREDLPPDQILIPTCQLEKMETESLPNVEEILKVEALLTPTPSSTALIQESTSDEAASENETAEEKPTKEPAHPNLVSDSEESLKSEMAQDTQTSLLSDESDSAVICDIPTRSQEKTALKPPTRASPLARNKPRFDPNIPVGMEFLIPKTGFFCKVCNRFFSGNKDTQLSHCKSLKHFENVQKHLKTTANATSSP